MQALSSPWCLAYTFYFIFITFVYDILDKAYIGNHKPATGFFFLKGPKYFSKLPEMVLPF